MIDELKIVDFHKYCRRCKYEHCSEADDICWDCLEEPVNLYSQKPINFKEKEEK